MEIKKYLKLNRLDYYTKHLQIANILLLQEALAPKETRVLAFFLSLEGDIAKDRFGTTARKMARETLNISSGGLGNYLKTFKEKGVIGYIDGELRIAKILFPQPDKQLYKFKLEIVE